VFRLGLIINPFAGIGGRVGLKGSDGEAIRQKALDMGALQLSGQKTEIALNEIKSLTKQFKIYTVSGEMGENLCQKMDLPFDVIYQSGSPSQESDTIEAVKKLQTLGMDLILFAGGDGTARNVFDVCETNQMVLGIPAGVKIHSGVYAISPQAAGLVTAQLIKGELMSLTSADVMDIDEIAFREGVVKAKKYGYLTIPAALEYVQSVKSGSTESEELVLDDIAAEVIESMDDDTYYVIGSGTTCAAIMEQLHLQNTLLGIDIVFQNQLYLQDATEKDLLTLIDNGKQIECYITVIGGQGHVLGRGNHQLSPEVVKRVGWEKFHIIATKTKLQNLTGKTLITDSGDSVLDKELSGRKRIITGYRDYVVFPVNIIHSEL